MPDNTYRKCLMALEVPEEMQDRFPEASLRHTQEEHQTVLGARLWTSMQSLLIDDPVLKWIHGRYTEHVKHRFKTPQRATRVNFCTQGAIVGFFVEESTVHLDGQGTCSNFSPEELESTKRALYDQQAACRKHRQNHVKGISLMDNRSYKRALKYFEMALSDMPSSPMDMDLKGIAPESKVTYNFSWTNLVITTLSSMGAAYAFLGKYKKSMECFDRSLKINPNNPAVFSNKGRALSIMKMHELAIENFDKAIKIRPDYDTAIHNKGISLLNLEIYDNAAECLDRVLKINPDYRKAAYFKKMLRQGNEIADENIIEFMMNPPKHHDVKCHLCENTFHHADTVWLPYIMEEDTVANSISGYGEELVALEQITDRNMLSKIFGGWNIECLGSCPKCSNVIPGWWFGKESGDTIKGGAYSSPITEQLL